MSRSFCTVARNFIFVICLLLNFVASASAPDYADAGSWAYYGEEKKAVDVFFIAPTVYFGSAEKLSMSLDDKVSLSMFKGATNMEKGIYDGMAAFYAPYYRQGSLLAYNEDGRIKEDGFRPTSAEAREVFATAYAGVKKAFAYYWQHENKGRPFIIAGFSQGADHSVRLLKDYADNKKFADQLIAAYVIGWRVTDADLAQLGNIAMAKGRTDTGVVVSFNSEAEAVGDSLMVPAGVRTYGINPLNWRADGLPASQVLNEGACFTNYSGEIVRELPWLCGAYLDEERGTLKVTGISAKDFPALLPGFGEGVYHIYDYMFFYRNLQQNVEDRIAAYLCR